MQFPDGFTAAEKERINQLYGHDFEGATAEDFDLISKWERHKAKQEIETSEKLRIMQDEIDARIEHSRIQAEATAEAMNAIRDEAIARYERTV